MVKTSSLGVHLVHLVHFVHFVHLEFILFFLRSSSGLCCINFAGRLLIIIVRAQLIQLLRCLVTKNLNERISGPNCNGKERASPVITLLSILLSRIRTSKELQSPLRLLGMALSCAGLILHPGSRVVRGDSFNPKVCCWRERANSRRKYHSGTILMIQNLVASNEYPSVTRKVLT
jgi:hypothetical protein